MYEGYYGFRKRPFAAIPESGSYFPAAGIEAARRTVERCIERAEGPAVVIGGAGTGKSLLCQLLAEQFRQQFAVAQVVSGGLTSRRCLLQAVLFALRRPYREMDEGELRLALVDYLTQDENCPTGSLLLVDEAQVLPLRLLEELRVLSNLVAGGQPRVRLVLCGAASLEERLASPRLESFNQRIVARCYLESLNRTETGQFIHSALESVGGSTELFPAEACDAVYEATGGVPRLINQLCDHALVLSFTAGRRAITAGCAREAWADLQQLPARYPDSEPTETATGVVEFGQLDDEAEVGGPAGESAGPSSLEPIERLDRIEQTLNALDEEFQAAGPTGPEVELVFDDHDPFAEQFQEEERVVDRYDGGAPSVWANTIDPPAAQPNGGDPLEKAYSIESVYCEPMPGVPAPSNVAAGPTVFSGAPGSPDSSARPAPHKLVAAQDGEPSTLPLRRPVREAEMDDSDMILIDEGYEVSQPHSQAVAPVRRQEYRQLFARLRRG